MTGVPIAAAMCAGPVLFDSSSRASPISAASSARPTRPASVTEGWLMQRRASSISGCSDASPVNTGRQPLRAAIASAAEPNRAAG